MFSKEAKIRIINQIQEQLKTIEIPELPVRLQGHTANYIKVVVSKNLTLATKTTLKNLYRNNLIDRLSAEAIWNHRVYSLNELDNYREGMIQFISITEERFKANIALYALPEILKKYKIKLPLAFPE